MSRLRRCPVTMGLGLILALSVFICGIPAHGEAGSARKKIDMERTYPDYYPRRFDGTGYIDRIGEEDEIVIDDSLYVLSARARYGTLKSKRIRKSGLNEGELVGYVTNDKGEIISMWKLLK